MKPAAPSPESCLLHLSGLRLPDLPEPPPLITLMAGQSLALILPEEALARLEACLLGDLSVAQLGGEVRLGGHDPAAEDAAASARISQIVSRTFSPLFGQGCWIENLDLEENILLPALMRGEAEHQARKQALALAQEFGLSALPDARRAAIKDTGILTICQWIRALMHPTAQLFLMMDPLRTVQAAAIEALARHCRQRRERDQSAFFWLLPEEAQIHAATLGVDAVLACGHPPHSPVP